MVLADSDRISRVPPYSGYCYQYKSLPVRGCHPLWPDFPIPFHFWFIPNIAALQPRYCRNNSGLGCSPFARHYWGNHFCFLFLRVLRCFSSPGWPYVLLRNIRHKTDGLSHSGACGSIRICQSPQIFAACHALLRLREPRHPPYALCNFLCFKRTLISVRIILLLLELFLKSNFNYLPLLLFPIMPKNFKRPYT